VAGSGDMDDCDDTVVRLEKDAFTKLFQLGRPSTTGEKHTYGRASWTA
jgi:hypothetical protein